MIIGKVTDLNNFAITSADIGSAMERAAAALKAGGNSLDESIALITAGNLIQQDADVTANALKVMSLRIRGATSELVDMGEETDGVVSSTSKLREEIKQLTGVDIMSDNNTFKSTAEIIKEIGEMWDELSDVSQANVLEKLAGKTRASTVSGLLENYQVIDEVISAAENASGSAAKENEKYMESISGHIDVLTNKWQELWASAGTRELVNTVIDFGSALLDVANNIGIVGSALAAIGIVKGTFKIGTNFDNSNEFVLYGCESIAA